MNLNLSYDGNVWNFKEDIIEKLSTGELYPFSVESSYDIADEFKTVTITCYMYSETGIRMKNKEENKITNKDSKYYKYYQEEIEELEQENKDLKEENEELRNELNSLLEEVNCSD